MKPIQFLERLSNDLTDLLNDNEDYNVLIETEEEPSMSLAILFVADDFGLEELANYVENYMLEVNVNYLHENFVFINKACFQHKSLKGLQNFYSEIIAKQPELIFNSKDFTKLSELALISLLKLVNNSYALDYYSYYGPIFGGRDLALEDNFKDEKRCWCKKRYYDRAIRKVDDAFSVEDYEIFQVVPKNNNVNNNYYLSNNNDSNDISSLDDE
ncbi:5763_t:CDS:2 [Entrophospora sp. SA101]|nr:5763_t:CDS:2 [Entrophospora sp. SA101]